MTPLDKVVYIADTIEPMRDFEGVQDLRSMTHGCTLNEVFVATYARSVSGVIERRRPIHPGTAEVWNWIVTEDV
jgi:HD superfamily phosphohydrolase YqeK